MMGHQQPRQQQSVPNAQCPLMQSRSRPLLPGLHVTPSRPRNVLTTSSARRLRLCGSKEEEGHPPQVKCMSACKPVGMGAREAAGQHSNFACFWGFTRASPGTPQ